MILLVILLTAAGCRVGPSEGKLKALTFFGWSDQHVQTDGNGEHLIPLFFYTWESHHKTGAYWYWPNVWQNNLQGDCSRIWSDDRFSVLVEEAGLVEYWREVGWPQACQPQGEGFACGHNIETARPN